MVLYSTADLKFHAKQADFFIRLSCEYWMDSAPIVRYQEEYKKYSVVHLKGQNRECKYCYCVVISCVLCFLCYN
jgi:hypothetical protein